MSMKTGDIFPDRIDLHLIRNDVNAMLALHAIRAEDPVDPDRPDDTPFYEGTGERMYRDIINLDGEPFDDWVSIHVSSDGTWIPGGDHLDASLLALPADWLNECIAKGYRRMRVYYNFESEIAS